MMKVNGSAKLRQWLVWLLFLCFVSDIIVDSMPPLHSDDLDGGSVAISALSGSDSNPRDDHPDCGFPDHGCGLSHHHHFPAVLNIVTFTNAVESLYVAQAGEVLIARKEPVSKRSIRGPPYV